LLLFGLARGFTKIEERAFMPLHGSKFIAGVAKSENVWSFHLEAA